MTKNFLNSVVSSGKRKEELHDVRESHTCTKLLTPKYVDKLRKGLCEKIVKKINYFVNIALEDVRGQSFPNRNQLLV